MGVKKVEYAENQILDVELINDDGLYASQGRLPGDYYVVGEGFEREGKQRTIIKSVDDSHTITVVPYLGKCLEEYLEENEE